MKLYPRIKNKLLELIYSHYKLLRISSYKDYIHRAYSDNSYIPLIKERKTIVYPISIYGKESPEAIESSLEDVFYTNIKNCKIIGRSNAVITKEHYLLYDYLANSKKSYVNVTDKGLLLLFNRVIHIGKLYICTYKRKSHEIIREGVVLSANCSNNYYHFMYEVLVKFDLISKSKLDSNIPIILDENIGNVHQMKELINTFNHEKRKIIYIKNFNLYSIKNAYFFSSYNEIPPNIKRFLDIKATCYAFDLSSISFLRQLLIRTYLNKKINDWAPKRIFISRSNCILRHNNEDEIFKTLKKYDFVLIHPESMSIEKQFRYFANAEIIIGASGAALSNILVCPKGCNILVLLAIKADITVFSNIAGLLSLNMKYIIGGNANNKSIHPDFNINIFKIESYLNSINVYC